MKLIDILNKAEKKEEGYFKFYVNYGPASSEISNINWIYKDGEIITEDDQDNIFYFLKNNVYSLSDEIIIIQEPLNEWKALRQWLEEQSKNCKLSGDVYRFTAYQNVLMKMHELDGKDESK